MLYLRKTLSLFHGMPRVAFIASAWSVGMMMGNCASASNFPLSSLDKDLISDVIWATVSPPLVIERTLLIFSVRRFNVLSLASELDTLQLATCTRVMGYNYIVSAWNIIVCVVLT